MLSLYARRLEMNNSKLVYDNFLAGKTYDWNDATFRTGLNQDYNASISGATDRVNYYMSFGYMNNEGAVQGNDYQAFRSNLKMNAKVTNWLEVGANVNFQDRSSTSASRRARMCWMRGWARTCEGSSARMSSLSTRVSSGGFRGRTGKSQSLPTIGASACSGCMAKSNPW